MDNKLNDTTEHVLASSDANAQQEKQQHQSNGSVEHSTSHDEGEETGVTTTDNNHSEPATASGRSRLRIVLLMSSLGLAVFLAALDQIIVATALPAIARSLGASSSTYAWIASAYLIAVASSIPIWGRVSDIFGRKPSILAANLIFMIGSVISAVAQSLTTLIAGRAVQGMTIVE